MAAGSTRGQGGRAVTSRDAALHASKDMCLDDPLIVALSTRSNRGFSRARGVDFIHQAKALISKQKVAFNTLELNTVWLCFWLTADKNATMLLVG
jgi:hypothetical protein